VASNSALLKIMATDQAQTSCSIAIRFYESGQPILRKVMSPMGLGCVKTPKLNLRTEISSRLQSF
jgi:hypothetical protein